MKCDNKKIQEEKRLTLVKNHWVHMSNERTFLAWISNNIGIMAFGFVIEKPFFTCSGSNQITSAQGAPDGFDYYALLGIFLFSWDQLRGLSPQTAGLYWRLKVGRYPGNYSL